MNGITEDDRAARAPAKVAREGALAARPTKCAHCSGSGVMSVGYDTNCGGWPVACPHCPSAAQVSIRLFAYQCSIAWGSALAIGSVALLLMS
jgi:hypothetical protein